MVILHCVSEYPTNIKDTKLGAIDQIKKFGYEVGFSTILLEQQQLLLLLKVSLEKHITLDNQMDGPDHKASLECKNLSQFVSNIRDIKLSLIDNRNTMSKKEA